MWDEADTTIAAVTAAPADAPLASVINSINFAGLSLHSPDSSHEPFTQNDRDDMDYPAAPEIAVIQADSSRGSPSAPAPRRLFGTHLSPSPSISTLATRRLSPTTSAADPRRTSVDLQSSFRLQLQNADMSFDLLNDKISFLSHDSFWAGTDDDSVDFKKEELAMLAIAEECEPQPIPEQNDVPLSAPTQSSVFSLPAPSQPSVERRRSLPSTSAANADPQIPSADAAEEHANGMEEWSAQGAAQTTSAPVPPAPVPALRIVKKCWKMHGRVSSVSSTTSSSSSVSSVPSDSKAKNVPAKRSAPLPREEQRAGEPPVPEMQKVRTIIKGLQRPPPGAQLPPMPSMGPAKMRAVSADAGVKKAAGSRPALGRMGPPPPPQRPAQVSNSKFPTSTFGITSRLPGLGSVPKTSGIPASSSGTLRQPRGGNAPVRSGLPVPQSRIPGAPGALRSGTASRLPTGPAATRRAL